MSAHNPSSMGSTLQTTPFAGEETSICENADSPKVDFVSEMRNMIVNNGLPQNQPLWHSQTSTKSNPPVMDGYLPPHMLLASPAEKSAYLSSLNPELKLSKTGSAGVFLRPRQAESRYDAQNLSKSGQQFLDGASELNVYLPEKGLDDKFGLQAAITPVGSINVWPAKNKSNHKPSHSGQPLPTSRTKYKILQPGYDTHHSGAALTESDGGQFQRQPAQHSTRSFQPHAGSSASSYGTGHAPRQGSNPVSNQQIQPRQPINRYVPRDIGHLPQQSHQLAAQDYGNAIHNPPYPPKGHGSPRTRPPQPLNSRLFDHSRQQQQQPPTNILPEREQVDYLEPIALLEISKAEITTQELQEKENFRLELHNVCQWAISTYERKTHPSFDPATVALKCFGSLSSGYATHGSDLDLALISPSSHPDAASPESEIPRLLEKTLLNEGYGARLLTRTRVPIIRLCQKPTPRLLQALLEERDNWEKDAQAEKDKLDPINTAATTSISNSNVHGTNSEPVNNLQEAPPEISRSGVSETMKAEEAGRTKSDSVNNRGEVRVDIPRTSPSQKLRGQPVRDKTIKFTENLRDVSITNPQVTITQISNVEQPSLTNSKVTDSLRGASTENHQDTTPHTPKVERTDEELSRLYTLAMKEGWFNGEERKLINHFINVLRIPHHRRNPQELEEARTSLQVLPDVLSRYREPRPQDTQLEFPKDGVGIQCDINFSNPLALHNTLLLRCYSHCDVRIRPLVLFLKAWAKKRKINSPYHGTLSSYGYVLMMLHYLINVVTPPLAPNLQLEGKAYEYTSPEETECNGCNVRFWRAEEEILRAAHRGQLTQNRQSIGSLLRGFFQYYAQEGRGVIGGGFSWSMCVVSLRTEGGLLKKQEKGWTGARTEVVEPATENRRAKEIKHRYLLAIEDPFELDHNVARPVAHHGICAIRGEFRRANALIQHGGSLGGITMELFAEGEEHFQERLFFGPNPERFNQPRRLGPQSEKRAERGPVLQNTEMNGVNKVQKGSGDTIINDQVSSTQGPNGLKM